METPGLPRDDLAAALAARRELGPDYDDAFIETLVDRIEETLAARQKDTARRSKREPAGEPRAKGQGDGTLTLAIVSLLTAIPLSGIGVGTAGLPGLLIAWVGIVLVNIVFGVLRR
ncbi:hypothetical protein [Actinomadura sp. SCN-SB]|uniref:hypothetical protein n=1 Tax=Actinomadura sp. SCN-SB TaxID=3373092 RepID=UPI00375349C1